MPSTPAQDATFIAAFKTWLAAQALPVPPVVEPPVVVPPVIPPVVPPVVPPTTGPPQRPTLLDAYPAQHRPTWPCAGVHYQVGPKVKPTKIVTGSMNATTDIDGFDFNGFQLNIPSSATIRVTNCLINAKTVCVEARGANLYFGNCTIDGGKLADFLIRMFGVTITIENCWLKDAGGDILSASEGGFIKILNNLIENSGWAPGAHGDWLQMGGTNRAANVECIGNTVYQTNTPASTQGFMVECNAPQTIASGRVANNTIVAVRTLPVPPNNANATNFVVGVTPEFVTGTVTIEDNFVDITGSAGGFGRGLNSPKVVVRRNKSLVNGAAVA